MVYKRYIKVGGKLYGPYVYGSKREKGKIVSEYVGKPGGFDDDKSSVNSNFGSVKKSSFGKIFLAGFFLALVIIFSIFFFKPTGNIVLDVQENYSYGNPLSGNVAIEIESGDLLQKDIAVILSLSKDGSTISDNSVALEDFINGQIIPDEISQTRENCVEQETNLSCVTIEVENCENRTVPIEQENCTFVEDENGTLTESCFNETIEIIETVCENQTVENCQGGELETICTNETTTDYYYQTPGIYSRNIQELLAYTFSEEGVYTLAFSIPSENIISEIDLAVSAGEEEPEVPIQNDSDKTGRQISAQDLSPGNINSCGVISSSGTYTLTQNVNNESTCFIVTANDVTLDCAGYTINYSQTESGYGVLANSVTGLSISGCNIVNVPQTASHGIYLNSSVALSIEGNSINAGGTGSYSVFAGGGNCQDNGLMDCSSFTTENVCDSVSGCSGAPGSFSCSGSMVAGTYTFEQIGCIGITDENLCNFETNSKCEWHGCSWNGDFTTGCGDINDEITCNGDTSGWCWWAEKEWDPGNYYCSNGGNTEQCEIYQSQAACEAGPCVWAPSCGRQVIEGTGNYDNPSECSDFTNWTACSQACESPGPECGGTLSGSCFDITSQETCDGNTSSACSWGVSAVNLSNMVFSGEDNWLIASAGSVFYNIAFKSGGTSLSYPGSSFEFSTSRVINSTYLRLGSNYIYLNATELNELSGTTAYINFSGLTYQNPILTSDFNDDGIYYPCNTWPCSIDNYAGGVLSFNVAHFTGYSVGENASLIIWDETDSGMPFGDQIKAIGDSVKFFANYSNTTGTMLEGNCTIAFNDMAEYMDYNSTSTFYEFNRTFSSAGTYSWNVSCNSTTAPYVLNVTDDVNIIQGCQVISSSGVYNLTQSVVSTGTCFTVTAENVTIDCGNWSNKIIYGNVSGGGPYYGIYSNRTNTTIKNCQVTIGDVADRYTDDRVGIAFVNNSNGGIENVNASLNKWGVYLHYSLDNTLNNIIASNCAPYGVYLYRTNDSTLTNISARFNQFTGIYLSNSYRNSLINSTITNSALGQGVVLESSHYNNLTGNVFNSNAGGIDVSGSNNNILIENTANSNLNEEGIQISSSSNNNTLRNNIANSNTNGYGIRLFASCKNNILENNIANLNGDGIYVTSFCENTFLINNTANYNSNDGISISQSSNYCNLINNSAWGNSNQGIGVVLSAGTNLSGNMANLNNYGFYTNEAPNTTLNGDVFANNSLYGIYMDIFNTSLFNNVKVSKNLSSAGWLSATAVSEDLFFNTTFSNADGSVKFDYLNITGTYSINDSGFLVIQNKVFLNSTALPFMNTSAEITLNGLAHTNPYPTVDFNDDGSYTRCPDEVCTEISYSGGEFVFNVTHFTGYSTSGDLGELNCTVVEGGCIGDYENYTDILHMSDRTDAHAEMPNGTDYNFSICCIDAQGIVDVTNSSGTNFLSLSDETDAHVEIPSEGNYPFKAYIGASTDLVYCSYLDTSGVCSSGSCLATLSEGIESNNTDLHIGDCTTDPYLTTVCCRFSALTATLISPSDEYYTNVTLQNYTVNMSSSAGLFNVTLKIYNQSDYLVNQTSVLLGGELDKLIGIAVNLSEGQYKWSYTIDDIVNESLTTENRTITIDLTPPNATLVSPANGSLVNTSSPNFTASFSDNFGFGNATLYIYNQTGALVGQTTVAVGGAVSALVGIVSTLADGIYTWFYTILDLAGNIFTSENYTIEIDASAPVVGLVNPADMYYTSNVNVTFDCNITDSREVSSLELYVWNSSQYNILDLVSGNLSLNKNFSSAGSNFDGAYAAAIDRSSNVYVVGTGQSLASGTSGADWWIKKFDSSGTEDTANWNKNFSSAGTNSDTARAVVVDSNNNVYVAGYGYNLATTISNQDWWIKKFDSSGTEDTANWNKNFSSAGSNDDIIQSMAVDSGGNVYLVGYGKNLASGTSANDWWIKKFSSSGVEDTANWNKNFSMGFDDKALSVTLDRENNIYVAGYNSAGNWWIKKFNSIGTEDTANWNKTITLTIGYAFSVAADSNNNVYVVGYGDNLRAASSNEDLWIKKFSSSGTEDTANWNKNFSSAGSNSDYAYSVAIDGNNNVYVVGYGTNLASGTSAGDWWIKKFNSNGVENTVSWNKNFSSAGSNSDYAQFVAADSNDVYVVGSGTNLASGSSGSDWWIFGFNNNYVAELTGTFNETSFNYTFSGENVNYTWNCLGYDDAGNFDWGDSNRTIVIDTVIPPYIEFVPPTETSGSYVNRSTIYVNVTAGDLNLANITIYLYNSSLDLINSTASSSDNYFESYTLSDGLYWFNATVFDFAGQSNSTETRNVTIDASFPMIQIVYPENITYNVNVSELNYTVFDTNLQACWYSLDSGITNVTITCGINASGLTSIEGSNTWTIWANDTAGNENSSSVTFFKDSIVPLIEFVPPTEISGSYVNRSDIYVNVSVTDTNIANLTIFLFNSTKDLINETIVVSDVNFQMYNLSDGLYFFNATVFDIAGSSNSTETRNVTIDTGMPNVTLISPANGSAVNTSNVNFTANASDNIGLANATLYIYNQSGLVNQTTVDLGGAANALVGIVVTLVDGVYDWFYTVFDFAGNFFTSENFTVTVDTITPGIQIVYPENITYNTNVSELNYTVSDINFDLCWYSLDSGVNNATIVCGVNASGLTSNEGSNTWTIWANDTAGNENSSSVTFFKDSMGPIITFIDKVPADLNTFDLFGIPLNITYNITDETSGVNVSTVYLFYKTNSTISDVLYYVNGSATSGYQTRTGINESINWSFVLYDNNVYPATYNFDEFAMEQAVHDSITLTASNQYVKIELLNVSNATQYNVFEVMANSTVGSGDMEVYYCNSSYATGNPTLNSDCTLFNSLGDTQTFNHTHSANSQHQTISLAINITTGQIVGVKVTPSSYFLLRGAAGSTWYVYNIANTSRTGAIETTANNGASWTDQTYTVDSHLHQYASEDIFRYYVCANDTFNPVNSACSIERTDLLELAGLPPIVPNVYNPAAGYYMQNISINYTAALSPNSYDIVYYNISLVNSTNAFNLTINTNNSFNLGYYWNTTEVSDGQYKIRVEACDNLSQCSFGYSAIFTIDNTNPNASLLAPPNQSFANETAVNFTANASDNLGLNNGTLFIYNQTGLVNQTTINLGGALESTVGIVVTLVDGVYNWFYTFFDLAGNFFTTGNFTVTVDTLAPNIQFVPPTETDGTYASRSELYINVTATDIDFANVTIYLFNSTDLINETTTASSPNFLNVSGLADGIYYFNATAYDYAGNSNSTETRNVTLDTINPGINFTYPTEEDGALFMRSNIQINVTAMDINFANMTIYLYNTTSLVNSYVSFGDNFVNATGLADGLYFFNATAYDYAGNRNSTETRNVTLDTEAPNATLISPANATYTNITTQNFTANASDSGVGLANGTLYIYNQTGLVNQTTINLGGAAESTVGIVVTLVDGVYTWFYTFFDIIGNFFTTGNFTLTVDSVVPTSSISSPTDSLAIGKNSLPYSIAGSANDDVLLNKVDVNINGSIVTASGTTAWSYSWNPTSDGTYALSSIAHDEAGNVETAIEYLSVSIYTTSTIVNASVSNSTLINSTVINSNVSDSIIIDSSVNDSIIVNSSLNSSIILNSTVINSTLVNSTLVNSYVINVTYINVSIFDSFDRDSVVIGGGGEIILDPSNLYNNVYDAPAGTSISVRNSTVWNTYLYNSSLENAWINDSRINDTMINNSEFQIFEIEPISGKLLPTGNFALAKFPMVDSVFVKSNLSDSNVSSTNVTYSNVTRSVLENSSVDSSLSVRSIVINCTLLNSTLIDSYCIDSTIINSTVLNSTINNTIINNSYVNNNTAIDYPVILLNYPAGGSYLNSSIVNFNWTAIQQHRLVDYPVNLSCNLTIDSAVNASGVLSFNGTATNYSVNLSDGLHFWNVTCLDQVRINISETRNLTIDTGAPNVTLISPANATQSNVTTYNFTANASDSGVGLANGTLYIYNQTGLFNQTTVGLGGAAQATVGIVVTLVEGVYHWFYTFFDLAGNFFTAGNFTVSADSTPPQVTIVSPSATTYTSADIPVNISLNEAGYCEFSLDGGVSNSSLTTSDNTHFTSSQTLSNAAYTLNAYCNDTTGNQNYSQSVSFTVSVGGGGGGGDGGGGGPVPCIANYVCGSWSVCVGGSQTRTCVDNNCNGPDRIESRSCEIICTPDWQCTDWSDCSAGGTSTRSCTDKNSCGDESNKPSTSLDCVSGTKQCRPNPVCGEWGICEYLDKVEDILQGKITKMGTQMRVCKDLNSCTPDYEETGACTSIIDVEIVLIKDECAGETKESIVIRNAKTKEPLTDIDLSAWQTVGKLNLRFLQRESTSCQSCYNGVQDKDEEGIDCGGVCKPCKIAEKRSIVKEALWPMIIALLAALLLILTHRLVKVRRMGRYDEYRKLFYDLLKEAKKAAADKDMNRLGSIYKRLRFTYYFLSDSDKIAVKGAMDSIYSKLEGSS